MVLRHGLAWSVRCLLLLATPLVLSLYLLLSLLMELDSWASGALAD